MQYEHSQRRAVQTVENRFFIGTKCYLSLGHQAVLTAKRPIVAASEASTLYVLDVRNQHRRSKMKLRVMKGPDDRQMMSLSEIQCGTG